MNLIDEVFSVIARLRSAELRLLSQENTEKAARIRNTIEEFSAMREKLIVLELAEAEEKLSKAEEHITEANSQLRKYLSDTRKADARLEKALEAVSTAAVLLQGISR